jgi:predicted nucleotidyltransferase
MGLEEVRAILEAHREELKALGVGEVYVFGSTARGEAGPKSDVDLIVVLERPLGFAFFELKERLEAWLGRPVDLTTPDGLREDLRESVLRSAIRAA